MHFLTCSTVHTLKHRCIEMVQDNILLGCYYYTQICGVKCSKRVNYYYDIQICGELLLIAYINVQIYHVNCS